MCFFSGLVAIARAKHPIPSRSRKLSAAAAMVLRLKTWESSSPPNLTRNTQKISLNDQQKTNAGWSSQVARQAHNLKVTGSNPVPATKIPLYYNTIRPATKRGFLLRPSRGSTVEAHERELQMWHTRNEQEIHFQTKPPATAARTYPRYAWAASFARDVGPLDTPHTAASPEGTIR